MTKKEFSVEEMIKQDPHWVAKNRYTKNNLLHNSELETQMEKDLREDVLKIVREEQEDE